MRQNQETFSDLFFSFEGRINRAKFWLYHVLILNTIYLTVYGFGGLIGGEQGLAIGSFIGWMVILWPGLALNIKRCHDFNRPGLFVLLGVIPVVNLFYAAMVLFIKGTDGPNKYGHDPLQAATSSLNYYKSEPVQQERKPVSVPR